MKIGLVTDSTADLPIAAYEEKSVVMVPLVVRFGDEVFKDWVEISPSDFFARMTGSDVLPKTSQPSVADFLAAYEGLGDCDHVISIHISSELSGTLQSAQIAAQSSPVPVTVVDSRLCTIALGLVVLAVAELRDQGLDVESLLAETRKLCGSVKPILAVSTLKYLQLGGRIGKAQALAGSLLNIKPLISLDDGVVTAVAKVKGSRRVFDEMVEFVLEGFDPSRPIHVILAHATAPEKIETLKVRMEEAGVRPASLIETEIGSVIGTYVGPEAFGVAFRQ